MFCFSQISSLYHATTSSWQNSIWTALFQSRDFLNMVKYEWIKTHQAVGPGDRFRFLVKTSAAQILFTGVLAMALSRDQPNLHLSLSFLSSILKTHLFTFWGWSRNYQSVKAIKLFGPRNLKITCLFSFLSGWRDHMGTTPPLRICFYIFIWTNIRPLDLKHWIMCKNISE